MSVIKVDFKQKKTFAEGTAYPNECQAMCMGTAVQLLFYWTYDNPSEVNAGKLREAIGYALQAGSFQVEIDVEVYEDAEEDYVDGITDRISRWWQSNGDSGTGST